MTEYGNRLSKLTKVLDEAKREMDLAREQCVRAYHLQHRGRRAATQASRAVVAGVDLGLSGVWPGDTWMLSAIRNPDDPCRPSGMIQIGEWKAELRSIGLGSGCNSDGMLRDDTALAIWIHFICPAMHRFSCTSKAAAGAFDFPRLKTDEHGRVIGRDGKALSVIEEDGSNHAETLGWHLNGPAARVTDHYDGVDTLEHIRCQVGDWMDAAGVAADIFRTKAKPPLAEIGSIKPTARTECGSILLFGRGENPVVNGVEKDHLSTAQYDVVLALLEAGDKGLTKDMLDHQSGHGDARKTLKRLAKDDDWNTVISFPGVSGRGYRLI